MDLWQETKDWVEAPFKENLAFSHVFLLTGAVVVSVIMWNLVLRKLATEV